MQKPTYEDYKRTMRKITDVNNAMAVLGWDKEVNLPSKGAMHRTQQVSTLAGIAHELFADEKFGDVLKFLNENNGLDDRQRRNVSLTLKDYNRNKKYSTEFVMKSSKVISEGYAAWLKAREANDFGLYREPLGKIVAIKREESEILGYKDHPYDALLDIYEPEAKTADIVTLFKDVRDKLVDFAKRIKAQPQVPHEFLGKFYAHQKQWDFGIDILKNMGYDFEAGRQDLSPHPFTTNFSPQDVRVTTRVDERDFGNMTWSCIHEGGHALYEQGLPVDEYGLPLGSSVSLGIHESQSRLWENNVGRSLPYWKAHYNKLQNAFPENLQGVPLEDFYKGINKVAPNLKRTEADELHYHFHVLIRFEIEKELLEGTLQVDDLDKYWNKKYKEYLGVDVPNDNQGILQDIHWAHGSIGYFPTYSLGSFYAVQFYNQAKSDIPGLEEQIQQGDNAQLLTWLRENIHRHGRYYSAEDLCQKVTGEKLNFDHFMKYAEEKYSFIYGL